MKSVLLHAATTQWQMILEKNVERFATVSIMNILPVAIEQAQEEEYDLHIIEVRLKENGRALEWADQLIAKGKKVLLVLGSGFRQSKSPNEFVFVKGGDLAGLLAMLQKALA